MEHLIAYTQSNIDSDVENLNRDYGYYLSWCAKDIYCNTILLKEFKRWMDRLETWIGDDLGYILHSELVAYDKWLSSEYNVASESTNAISELCSTWKYMVILECKNALKQWEDAK